LGQALPADRRRRAQAAPEHFVIDGEAVVLDKDGISDFDALASRKHDKLAQFCAFDMLAGDGEEYRPQALSLRKANLARLKRGVDGIFIAEYEQRDIGDDLFRAACKMDLKASSRSVLIAPMVLAMQALG
jgi:bifunctional non-homologous end joining protein LigD